MKQLILFNNGLYLPTSTAFSLTSLTLDNSYFGNGVLPALIEQSRSTLVSLFVIAPTDGATTPPERLTDQLGATEIAPNLQELYVGIIELKPFIEACTSLEMMGIEVNLISEVLMWDLPKPLKRVESGWERFGTPGAANKACFPSLCVQSWRRWRSRGLFLLHGRYVSFSSLQV